MKLAEQKLLVADGACGTNLQELRLPASAWGGCEGCNEYLNLGCPEAIVALHAAFVEAGAQLIETNTFGASRIVLAEYGLEERVAAINEAAVALARQAIGGRTDCWVAGSLGPSTKLPSLGHISRDALYAAYAEQIGALAGAGVDVLLLETCQDLLQVKTAAIACFETLARLGRDIPVMVSVTLERTGTLLVGSDIAAAVATLEPFPLFSLGLNCATGPEDMLSAIRYLSQHWPGRVSCMPNQGLPQVVNGRTVYPLTPDAYARHMRVFVEEYGVDIVGGCCGTTPAHTRRLVEALQGVQPRVRQVSA